MEPCYMQSNADSRLKQACLIAGHGLGGALGYLCAFDIAATIKEAGANAEGGEWITVSCYTCGAPNTETYNALVPDRWAVINKQMSACHACCELPHRIVAAVVRNGLHLLGVSSWPPYRVRKHISTQPCQYASLLMSCMTSAWQHESCTQN